MAPLTQPLTQEQFLSESASRPPGAAEWMSEAALRRLALRDYINPFWPAA